MDAQGTASAVEILFERKIYNPVLYGRFVQAAVVSGRPELAVSLLNEMRKHGPLNANELLSCLSSTSSHSAAFGRVLEYVTALPDLEPTVLMYSIVSRYLASSDVPGSVKAFNIRSTTG